MSNRCWTASVAAIAISIAAPAVAQERTYAFNIPSQELGSAIRAFAKTTHQQVSFSGDDLVGKRSNALKGNYSATDALQQLVKDTGVGFRQAQPGLFILAKDLVGNGSNAGETATQQIESASSSGEDTAAGAAADSESAGNRTIVVTGSRIPVQIGNSSHDVKVYDSTRIARSGQATISDFLNTLSSISIATTENPFQTSVGATTVRLRGLPFGSTLVLLNGRRVQTSGAQSNQDFFDLNNIPVQAVERIEVLGDGASAVYGSDAIAGVVNIILKKKIEGLQVEARRGFARDTHETSLGVATGLARDRFSASLVGSYLQRDALFGFDRKLTASNDYTALGGPNNNLPVCSPGNAFSVDGSPLPGAPSGVDGTTAAVSSTAPSSGRPSLSDFRFGDLNSCSLFAGGALIPKTERYNALGTASMEISPTTELFAELLFSKVKQDYVLGTAGLFGVPGFQFFTVGPDNPYNPFGVRVGIATLLPDGLKVSQNSDTNFYRVLTGARGKFSPDWSWEVAAWHSADRTKNVNPNVLRNDVALQAALDSTDPNVALNPFTTGPLGPLDQLETFYSSTRNVFKGEQQALNAFVTGKLPVLPAGPVGLVVGGELVRNALSSKSFADGVTGPTASTDFDRVSYAVFAEARVPILGSTADGPREILTATLAGRVDHYSDFGTTATPQFGAELRPTNDLLLRGTLSRSFKAPALANIASVRVVVPNNFIVDPATGNFILVDVVTGGNPDLNPQRGKSYTLGFSYTPALLPGLRLGATRWSIQQKQTVQSLSPQFIVDNEALFPGRVSRNAVGEIMSVDATPVNFGSIDVAGIDYDRSYRHKLGAGTLNLGAQISQFTRYKTALVPGSPSVNGLARAQDSGNWTPRWKGILSAGYETGRWHAGATGRYVGNYRDYSSTRTIGNFWIFDANGGVDIPLGASGARRPSLVELEAGVVNLFDRKVQYSNYSGSFVGYDPAQADIRGRFVYARAAAYF